MEEGDYVNFKRVRQDLDSHMPQVYDRRASLVSNIDIIMEGGTAPEGDAFPAGWFGEKENLVNMKPFHVNVTFEDGEYEGNFDEILKTLQNYAMLVDQNLLKLYGNGRHAYFQMYRKMGIASTYSQRSLGHSTSFYSTLVQVLEALGPIKKKIFNLERKSSLLLVNDTSNALTVGSLLISKQMNVLYNWTGVISGLFNEDVVRNYHLITDLVNFGFQDQLHRSILLDDNVIEEMSRVIDCLWRDLGYSTILADVTGEHLLESLENVTDFEGTKWLFLTRHLIQNKLDVNGNVILRLQVRPLLNKSFLRLLIDISKDFKTLKWILPLGGRDLGIVFLVLEEYYGNGNGSSNDLFDAWPVPQSIPVDGEELDFIHVMNKVLKVVVPAYVDFIDSSLQMMYLEEQVLHNCMLELERRRKKALEKLGTFVKMYIDAGTIKDFVDGGRISALIFNWFHHQPMAIDGQVDLCQTNLKDQHGLLQNVDVAKRLVTDGFLSEALNILRTLSLECSYSWEKNNPKFLVLERPIVLLSDWVRFPFSTHPMNTIVNSRWCLSGLVPIRGALKDILSPHVGVICRAPDLAKCPLCRTGEEFNNFLKTMIDIFPFKAVSQEKVYHLCLYLGLKDFITKNDKELCYIRIRKVIALFSTLKEGDSIYLCNPCLLTRLDMGLIYLLSSSFFKTILITSVEPSPTYGVFFHNLNTRFNTELTIKHINHSLTSGRSELVVEERLNKYFGTHLLHVMNISLLRNWVKAVYRDLEVAGLI